MRERERERQMDWLLVGGGVDQGTGDVLIHEEEEGQAEAQPRRSKHRPRGEKVEGGQLKHLIPLLVLKRLHCDRNRKHWHMISL